jgi:alpha-L-fucosidase
MQRSWGYHSHDYDWKPANQMLRYLVNNISKGGNYLLNIGPKANGTIPLEAQQRLKEIGAWIGSNQEAIYNVTHSGILTQKGVLAAENEIGGKKLYYLYISDPDLNGELALDIPFDAVALITKLDSGMPYQLSNKSGKTGIAISKNARYDSAVKVLKIVLK